MFAGYNRYDYMMKYGRKLQQIPAFIRRAASSIMEAIPADSIPVLNKKYLFHSRYEKLKGLLKNSSEESFFKELSQQTDADKLAGLFKSC